jgi:hypothetical protein
MNAPTQTQPYEPICPQCSRDCPNNGFVSPGKPLQGCYWFRCLYCNIYCVPEKGIVNQCKPTVTSTSTTTSSIPLQQHSKFKPIVRKPIRVPARVAYVHHSPHVRSISTPRSEQIMCELLNALHTTNSRIDCMMNLLASNEQILQLEENQHIQEQVDDFP